MKTTAGSLMVGFASEELAQNYIHATGHGERFEAISRNDLLAANPKAFAGIDRILLFPSSEILHSFFSRPRETFPFADYVVDLQQQSDTA
jgi:hypothetical protein